jgi:hypothetical protein
MSQHEIINVRSRKQLFIDNRFFARQYGMKLTVNPPVKAEMVMRPETPWERSRMGAYASVLEDKGVYKLWYNVYQRDAIPDGLPNCICYATSTDGLEWTRETVNLFDWYGHRENNIVLPGAHGGVTIDSKAPPEYRYKALAMIWENALWPESQGADWEKNRGGIHLLTSPDGIRWTRVRPAASPWFHDSLNVLMYDDRIGKHVAYLRTAEGNRWAHRGSRTLARVQLDDPVRTPWPYRPLPPGVEATYNCVYHGQFDITLATDESDPPDSDLQMCPIVKYPWAEDVYLGLFAIYRHYPDPPEGEYANDGPNAVQLAVSRDGIDWQRPERKPYVPLGMEGEFDAGCIWPTLGMIRRGNEIWQYYSGCSHTHGAYDGETAGEGGLRLLRQRLDGFVSADAAYTGGEFSTPLLTFDGSHLELNLDCSAEGEVRVEVLDEGNRPIEGFTLAESSPVDRNRIAAAVRWKQRDSVAELSGRPIRLHVRARACKLYAFQFVKVPTAG